MPLHTLSTLWTAFQNSLFFDLLGVLLLMAAYLFGLWGIPCFIIRFFDARRNRAFFAGREALDRETLLTRYYSNCELPQDRIWFWWDRLATYLSGADRIAGKLRPDDKIEKLPFDCVFEFDELVEEEEERGWYLAGCLLALDAPDTGRWLGLWKRVETPEPLLTVDDLVCCLVRKEAEVSTGIAAELATYAGTAVEEEDIRVGYQRLAHIFERSPAQLKAQDVFGEDLPFKRSFFFSDYSATAEMLEDDLQDMGYGILGLNGPQDLETLGMNNPIRTVREYVVLLAHCRLSPDNRDEYQAMRTAWEKEEDSGKRGSWRQRLRRFPRCKRQRWLKALSL